jgi:hypothetical protein
VNQPQSKKLIIHHHPTNHGQYYLDGYVGIFSTHSNATYHHLSRAFAKPCTPFCAVGLAPGITVDVPTVLCDNPPTPALHRPTHTNAQHLVALSCAPSCARSRASNALF